MHKGFLGTSQVTPPWKPPLGSKEAESHPISHTHAGPPDAHRPPPQSQGHRETPLSLQRRLCTNIYIAPRRGLQQTQHGGAALRTLSRPQSGQKWLTPSALASYLTPGWDRDRKLPRRPGQPTPAQERPFPRGLAEKVLAGGRRAPQDPVPCSWPPCRGTCRCSQGPRVRAAQTLSGRPKVDGATLRLPPPREVLPVSNLIPPGITVLCSHPTDTGHLSTHLCLTRLPGLSIPRGSFTSNPADGGLGARGSRPGQGQRRWVSELGQGSAMMEEGGVSEHPSEESHFRGQEGNGGNGPGHTEGRWCQKRLPECLRSCHLSLGTTHQWL